jgi:hypothetical protein
VARVDLPRRILHDLQVEQHGEVAVTLGTIEFIYSDPRSIYTWDTRECTACSTTPGGRSRIAAST